MPLVRSVRMFHVVPDTAACSISLIRDIRFPVRKRSLLTFPATGFFKRHGSTLSASAPARMWWFPTLGRPRVSSPRRASFGLSPANGLNWEAIRWYFGKNGRRGRWRRRRPGVRSGAPNWSWGEHAFFSQGRNRRPSGIEAVAKYKFQLFGRALMMKSYCPMFGRDPKADSQLPNGVGIV